MNYVIGIIGCGKIGRKRAEIIKKFPNSKIKLVCDIDIKKAESLATELQCGSTVKWRDIVNDKDINIVIISTINDSLSQLTIDSIKNNKNVLVEKPAGRNPIEILKIIKEYKPRKNKLKIKVGFNHRFHPAIEKAKEILFNENIGDIMFIRARYGHGGRLGYDKEWRAYKDKAGGGEMLDQGSHLVDLSRYFICDFDKSIGYCKTFFWDMKVEDNCFALLKTKKGQIAQLHASCTQWKNIFSMEIFCKTGQINIDGLGGSYGKETLTFYKMKYGMGVPDKFVFDWETDDSWEKEYANFIESIELNKEPNGNIYDAYESIKLINDIYKWNKSKKPIFNYRISIKKDVSY